MQFYIMTEKLKNCASLPPIVNAAALKYLLGGSFSAYSGQTRLKQDYLVEETCGLIPKNSTFSSPFLLIIQKVSSKIFSGVMVFPISILLPVQVLSSLVIS